MKLILLTADARIANNSNSPVANDNKDATALSPQPNATANVTNNNNVRYNEHRQYYNLLNCLGPYYNAILYT